jgi:type IV pilus assembly protein PilC
MAIYKWEGKTRQGATQKGEVEAPNDEFVKNYLRQKRIIPTKIKQKKKDILEGVAFLQPKVTEKNIVIFTRQFATMIDAGVPIVQGLDIVASQNENPTFKKILFEIKEDIETGSTMADALGKHPKQFDELFVNLVAAGEVGGILDVILNRLAVYIEKSLALKKKVKSAMVYPLTVLIVSIAVITILLVFVIPIFQKMFADFGGALPAPTQFVINMSDALRANILYLIGGIVAFIFIFRYLKSTDKGKAIFDDLILKSPIFGTLIKKVAVARFTRTLGTMVSSGVPILDALNITAKTAGNKTVERAIYFTRASISEGKTIAEPLEESGVFPPMVVQMIAVGESTGALDDMLNKIADFYDEEVDNAVETLTSLLEPIMMVFLGGVIGGLVVTMYLPIFKMASAIGGD